MKVFRINKFQYNNLSMNKRGMYQKLIERDGCWCHKFLWKTIQNTDGNINTQK